MNDIGLSLIAAAAQVTLVTAAAILLYAIAARRGPGHGAGVASACLGASAVLTLLAFVPLPAWWTWNSTAPNPVLDVPANPAARTASVSTNRIEPNASANEGVGLSLGFLHDLWQRIGRSAMPTPARPWQWPAIIAVVALAGTSYSLLRLLLGLWAVERCRRRSRPIDDAALLGVLEDCRCAMGCGLVEVRESSELGAPATMGCHKRLVLLPADWRTWSELELRAVLAHELAHVRRRDYLVWLLARVGVALHFYHPLVRWLAGRLRLQQELAADALGARHAGGRSMYLRALSQLALRQDSRPVDGLATSFLSTPGTLMRRIQMLRGKDGSFARPISRLRRVCVVALLAVITLGVSALRSPGQKAEEPARRTNALSADSIEVFYAGGFQSARGFAFRGAGQEMRVEAKREPFDLSYLSPDAKGVWAFRPAALLSRTEMKKHVALFDGYIRMGIRHVQTNATLDISAADIDLIAGQLTLSTNPKEKEHPSALMNSLTVIRSVKDFDWKKQIDKILPGTVEVPCEGKAYYQIAPSDSALIGLLGLPSKDFRFHFCLPDGRTLVCDTEAMLRCILKRENGKRPNPIWAADWKHVEGGLFAAAYDTRDKKWLQDRKKVVKETNAAEDVLIENASSIVFGVDVADGFVFQAFIRSETEQAADKATEAIRALIDRDQQDIKRRQAQAAGKKATTIADRFLADLRAHTRIERQGKTVIWRSEVQISLADLMAAIPDEIRAEIEKAAK